MADTNLEIRGKGDVAVILGLDGLNPATLFKVVEQFSGEFLQQTEVTPLAVATVTGLVGGEGDSSHRRSKWQTLKIPIPAASSGALRNFAPSGTGLLAYFIWASPSGTLGSGHSSHQQAGGYSGI
jgi:hypothetical protein